MRGLVKCLEGCVAWKAASASSCHHLPDAETECLIPCGIHRKQIERHWLLGEKIRVVEPKMEMILAMGETQSRCHRCGHSPPHRKYSLEQLRLK